MIVELNGLLEVKQLTANTIILSDNIDKTADIFFLHYVEQKISVKKFLLHQKTHNYSIMAKSRWPSGNASSVQSKYKENRFKST